MLQQEKKYFQLIAGQPMPGGRLLRFFLRAAAVPYSIVVQVRNWIIDSVPGRVKGSGVPVISVGNVTTGGTGKTPVVALIVNRLAGQKLRPGIVSRGYRSLSDDGNDEKRVLAALCPNVPHVQNRNRVAAARKCVSQFEANVLVADDAFQHRRLARDLDIVLVDALNPWGHGFVLPRGLLREPLSGLRRADLVILTRADLVSAERRAEIWSEVRRWCSPPGEIEICFEPDELIDLDGRRTPLTNFDTSRGDQSSRKVLAFCGIGNPDGFRRTLDAAGISILDLVAFPDHHHYQPSDLQQLTDMAQEMSATSLLTTAKDLVKIQLDWVGSVPLFALNIKAKITSGRDALDEAISRIKPPPTR